MCANHSLVRTLLAAPMLLWLGGCDASGNRRHSTDSDEPTDSEGGGEVDGSYGDGSHGDGTIAGDTTGTDGGSTDGSEGPWYRLTQRLTYPIPNTYTEALGLGWFGVEVEGDKTIWVTDGTALGTRQIALGTGDRILHQAGSKVVFEHAGPGSGSEPWVSDGTPEGTSLLRDINPGTAPSQPVTVGSAGGWLYFLADDGQHGNELWATDGTPQNTHLLRDFWPGNENTGGLSTRGVAVGNRFYFSTYTGAHGNQLFVSDGRPEGTTMLTPTTTWGGPLANDGLIAFGGRVYFVHNLPNNQGLRRIWVTDGTPEGTTPLLPFDYNRGSDAQAFAVTSGRLVFFANAASGQLKLWSSDGTAEGSAVLADVVLNAGESHMPAVGGRVVFNGKPVGSSEPFGVWATDGTKNGTRQLSEIPSVNDRQYGYVGGQLLYYGSERGVAHYDPEPWVSDGTPDGTRPLGDLWEGSWSSQPQEIGHQPLFVSLGEHAYFPTDLAGDDRRLYRTDGTPEGTGEFAPADATATKDALYWRVFPYGNSILMFARFHGELALYRYAPTEVGHTDGTDGTDGVEGTSGAEGGDGTDLGGTDGVDEWDGDDGVDATDGTCLPKAALGCYQSDAYWFDSCGNPTTLADDCGTSLVCHEGTCKVPTVDGLWMLSADPDEVSINGQFVPFVHDVIDIQKISSTGVVGFMQTFDDAELIGGIGGECADSCPWLHLEGNYVEEDSTYHQLSIDVVFDSPTHFTGTFLESEQAPGASTPWLVVEWQITGTRLP